MYSPLASILPAADDRLRCGQAERSTDREAER